MSFLNTRTRDEEYSNDPQSYLDSFADDISNKVADIKEFTDEKKDRMDLQRAEQFRIKQYALSIYNECLMYILGCVIVIVVVIFVKNQFEIPNVLVICIIILAITITLVKCVLNIAYINSKSDTKYGVFVWDYKSPNDD